ncbi:hypothetical protein IV203_023839 [Nitzschia inconspicua]|uniref:Uncharacterized protein n=1 Tax=Nitzschia inconspicua TaxID=303405 RepID=A0A9K3KBH1_9STRA|nr:hypothetical protein IV203_023839 [Nitzschia inconspicua]
MSSSSVWVQLFYEDKRKGNPAQIYKSDLREGRDWNVASLSELVKDKLKEELDHAGFTEIFVYPPDTEQPFSQDKALNSWDPIPSNSSGPQPLIVVAPDPPQQQPANEIAFLVGGTVIDAKQSKGARGNVFKFLENHYGHYSLTDGIQVDYTGNNLTFKAYFRSYDAACAFQNAMNQWEIHKELAHLGGVTLDPPTPAAVPWQSDFTRFYLQDYKPNDHESPCQTLDQLHSYHLSVPVTEPVEPTSNLLRYQCIDQPMPHINHYKCHLKDKAKFKQLQRNENNMVAASWLFHQQLDGLNVAEGIPLVALSFKTASNDRLVSHNRRYRVTLLVEFFYQELAAAFAPTGLARKIDETSWEISLYVEDKDMFKECIDWKSANTKKQWNDHREFLNAE